MREPTRMFRGTSSGCSSPSKLVGGSVASIAQLPAAAMAPGAKSATGGAFGTPYSYGPLVITGIRSKLATGTGVGICHSSPREAQGFSTAGSRTKTSDQTRLAMKTSIEKPRTYADAETKSFNPCRCGAYVETRRGMLRKPAAKSGKNVRLKKTNISQKWIFASVSFSVDRKSTRLNSSHTVNSYADLL